MLAGIGRGVTNIVGAERSLTTAELDWIGPAEPMLHRVDRGAHRLAILLAREVGQRHVSERSKRSRMRVRGLRIDHHMTT